MSDRSWMLFVTIVGGAIAALLVAVILRVVFNDSSSSQLSMTPSTTGVAVEPTSVTANITSTVPATIGNTAPLAPSSTAGTRPPVYLADRDPVRGSELVTTGRTVSANGRAYVNGIIVNSCASGSGKQIVEYDLGRSAARLTGVVAFKDDSPSHSRGFVAIYLDGARAFASALEFGQTVSFDVPTAGVLRLLLEVSSGTTQDCAFANFVFGDPALAS